MNYRNDSHEVLKGLVCSRLRRRILSSLDRPMRLRDLKHALGANAPNTSSKAKDLQEAGLIKRNNGDYCITGTGRIVEERLSVLFDTVESVMGHGEFWSRMIDKLPGEILDCINTFKDAELVKNGREELDRVERTLLGLMDGAEDELVVVLPANSRGILAKAEELSTGMKTRVVTLRDNPNLHYGMISSKGFVALFTEVMDMALVKKGTVPQQLIPR